MAKLKLVALTKAVAGREAEFDRWYDDTHVPELLALNGVENAQRYKLITTLNGAEQGTFLALYDVEVDDPASFLGEMGEVAASGKMSMTDSMDSTIGYAALFVEHGGLVTR